MVLERAAGVCETPRPLGRTRCGERRNGAKSRSRDLRQSIIGLRGRRRIAARISGPNTFRLFGILLKEDRAIWRAFAPTTKPHASPSFTGWASRNHPVEEASG